MEMVGEVEEDLDAVGETLFVREVVEVIDGERLLDLVRVRVTVGVLVRVDLRRGVGVEQGQVVGVRV